MIRFARFLFLVRNTMPVAKARRALIARGAALMAALMPTAAMAQALPSRPSYLDLQSGGIRCAPGATCDGSPLKAGPPGGVLRSLADRAAESTNVLDLGADRTGAQPSINAIKAAIARASASAVASEVRLPAGRYVLTRATGRLDPASHVTLRGAGMGRTVIVCDDTGNVADCIGNATGTGATFNPVEDFHLRDLTIEGRGEADRTIGSQTLRIGRCTQCSVEGVEVRNSRFMGLVFHESDGVTIRGNRVYRSNRDGIAVWDTSNAIIADNTIVGANDDAISAHVSEGVAVPVRSGLVITNNTITESQGIRVLGAKATVITGNVLRRIMAHGISVEANDTLQGMTSPVAVNVSGNVITDVFRRIESPALNQDQYYIYVSGGPRTPGSGASAPGMPVAGTGTVTPLFGTNGISPFYANENNKPTVNATPGGHWIDVSGNTLVRTLPEVTAYANWGFGPSLFVGSAGAGRLFAGAVPEDNLRTIPIKVGPTLRNSRIADNTIATGGRFGIHFVERFGASKPLDYDGLLIEGNKISDFRDAAIWGAPTDTAQRITIRNNEFDGDPRFVHANRGAGGKWTNADNKPIGVYTGGFRGLVHHGNSYRNLFQPVAGTDNPTLGGNVIYADPVAVGGSLDNRGVTVIPDAALWTVIVEDSDPGSATYGQVKTSPVLAATAQPTTGPYVAGHSVRNALPSVSGGKLLLGWTRLTTGAGHVAGTDWSPLYATAN